jgi:transcriptional regulator with XRE-family HTH domain
MANKIKEIRKSLGWSGETLGEKIGVGKAMISKLEKGEAKLTLDYIERLCAAFKCSQAELLGKAPLTLRSHAPPLPDAPKHPYDEALDAHGRIIAICRELSPEGKAQLDPTPLFTKILETLGITHQDEVLDAPKTANGLKKTAVD